MSEVLLTNAGHRQRLRAKFLAGGEKSLHDYELIELLLTYAIPRRDVKPPAKMLLGRFGSIGGVMSASQEELRTVPGIGENAAVLMGLLRVFGVRYLEEKAAERDLLADSEALCRFARMKIGGLAHETFMVIFLDSRNRLLGYECVEGTIDRAAVYERNVVEWCLRYRAVGVVLAHNHPSGDCMPSREDRDLTSRIVRSLSAINVAVYEHLILSRGTYLSMKARRYM